MCVLIYICIYSNGSYNKVPEMFASQREYNDYEEMVEDISTCVAHTAIHIVAYFQLC